MIFNVNSYAYGVRSTYAFMAQVFMCVWVLLLFFGSYIVISWTRQ